MIVSRRSFLIGVGALIAAPAVVRSGILMPVKAVIRLPNEIYVSIDRKIVDGVPMWRDDDGTWAVVEGISMKPWIPTPRSAGRLPDPDDGYIHARLIAA